MTLSKEERQRNAGTGHKPYHPSTMVNKEDGAGIDKHILLSLWNVLKNFLSCGVVAVYGEERLYAA
jgi:hypothetical protein